MKRLKIRAFAGILTAMLAFSGCVAGGAEAVGTTQAQTEPTSSKGLSASMVESVYYESTTVGSNSECRSIFPPDM